MNLEQRLRDFFNPIKDLNHFDFKWYTKKYHGDADDLEESTTYMATKVLGNLPKHFIRGAFLGAITGLTASQFSDNVSIVNYAVIGGTIDWTQYGIRILKRIIDAKSRNNSY